MQTDIKEVIPKIDTVDDMDQYLQTIYTIEPYLISFEVFEDLYTRLYNVLKGCIEKRDCITRPIKFKFYKDDKKTYTLEFRHFIANLIFWEPYVTVNTIKFLDESYIMDCNNIIVKEGYDLDDWINRIAFTLRNFNVKETTVDKCISYVNRKIRDISIDFSIIMNLNFSYFTFLDMYKKYPRVREIMECKFDPSMSTRDIEKAIESLTNEEIEIYKNDPGNPIGTIFKSGTGIKHKRLCRHTVMYDVKLLELLETLVKTFVLYRYIIIVTIKSIESISS